MRNGRGSNWQSAFGAPVPRLNPLAGHEYPTWPGPGGSMFWADWFVYRVGVPQLVNGASAQLNFQIAADSSFEWVYSTTLGSLANTIFNVQTLGLVYTQFADGGSSRNLFNQPIPSAMIGGIGPYPHYLPIPRRFVSNSQMNINIVNNSGGTWYNIDYAFHGRKIFNSNRANLMSGEFQFHHWKQGGKTYAQDYYCYATMFPEVAAGASVTQQIKTDQDSSFELMQLMGGIEDPTIPQVAPWNVLTCQIQDGSSMRALFNNPTEMYALFGPGGQPYVLPIPRVFLANTPINVTLTNGTAANQTNVWVVLEGRKIFEVVGA